MPTPKQSAILIHCECGEAIHGDPCSWTGPRSETVLIEYMPLHLRASHAAARNHGVYPHNGAIRLRVERSCADRLIDGDEEWTSIVDGRREDRCHTE